MKVRSAMIAMLALGLLVAGPLASAPVLAAGDDAQPRVTIALVPHGTGVEDLVDAVPAISPGLLSGGLGDATSAQSYLDIGQGSRLSRSLYPKVLPPVYVTGDRVPERIWRQVRGRASNAPAEIVPGLLATTLQRNGVPAAARPDSGSAAIIVADASGRIERARGCRPPRCPGVTAVRTDLAGLGPIAAGIDPARGDLLIVIERPPTDRELATIGVLGAGFGDGDLTSATTRMDGYVLAIDLLPTILARYAIAIPDGVTGREIESTGGEADAGGLVDREDRLEQIGPRRWPVLGINLLIWVGLLAAASAIWRRRGAAIGLPLLAVSMAWEPAMLLLGAALAPTLLVERLLIGVGVPIVAAASLLVARRLCGARGPYAAFAIAAAVSVGATALDMAFGSALTALSLIGPNPALGVRFFGIGNELEATIAVLIVLGAGAGVTALRPLDPYRAMAITTFAVTAAAVLFFAPGRLGADVGAAITFPAGAAVAVIVALGLGRRQALLVLAAPLVAVALLVVIDLVSGGNAHLSRSVLGADSAGALGDVFERRLIQAARTFPRYLDSPFFIPALVAIAAGIRWRARIRGWLVASPAAYAGLAGAAAATLVGTLANDSGALLLIVGVGFMTAFCGLAWATAGDPADPLPR